MDTEKRRITLDCRVDSYRSGWTVVEFLSHRFRYHPSERWVRRVSDGRVLVNGTAVTPDDRVCENDVVSYTILHNEPEVDSRYDVIHEDNDILAVSKSGHLPVHAGGPYIKNTLIAALKNRYGDHVNLAHRLDRETSGLVVVTKSPEAARGMARMFANGEVSKAYVAIVHGRVSRAEFQVDAAIGKTGGGTAVTGLQEGMRGIGSDLDLRRSAPRRRVDFVSGKPARTTFRVRGYGARITVLEARPLSGRTNQIRVHLHHIGHALVGDKVYGDPARDAALGTFERHALHCGSLAFNHPVTGVPIRLRADTPDDLVGLIRREL